MQLHIPTIVISELYFGLEKNQSHKLNATFLENFIAPLSATGFSAEAAKHAAKIRYQLRRQGTQSAPMTSRSPPLLWLKTWFY